MSMMRLACPVCDGLYHVGVVGSDLIGGHDCPVKRERDELQAQLDEAREAFAQVAMKLLLNGEPTAGELREQLVKAGIDGPDRLSELASPPTESK